MSIHVFLNWTCSTVIYEPQVSLSYSRLFLHITLIIPFFFFLTFYMNPRFNQQVNQILVRVHQSSSSAVH